MEIKQNPYTPEGQIYWYGKYIIVSSKVYDDMKEHFRKEFEAELLKNRKTKWYEKIINALKWRNKDEL